jgi:AraC-like DNA-binding protein
MKETSALIEGKEVYIQPSEVLLINISREHQLNQGEWINILVDPDSELSDIIKKRLSEKAYLINNETELIEKLAKGLSKVSNNLRAEIKNAITLIKSHDHNCKIDEIAQQVGLSPDRFRHLFKEELGITFKNYIKWQKIRRAFTLKLANQEMTMTQIAHDSGFSDQAHMSRVIKENFGHTPKFLSKKVSR